MVAGGWKAIRSVLNYAGEIGPVNLWQSLHSKNACKACAFGTGGQNGGLYNERNHGIEICNKNIQAHTSDARKAIPNMVFFNHSIAELAQKSGLELERLGRLGTPLYKAKGDSHYAPISYARSLDILSDRLKVTSPNRSFFYASGRSSNEAAFLLQLFARLYGTNNVNNCSYYCHQASGVGLTETIGTGTATVEYNDLDKADTVFVFGANPASNHPRFVKTLIKLRRRGGTVIIVNPAKESGLVKFASPSDLRSMLKGGERIASQYIQPHLGGDIAFMQGVIKALLESEQLELEFFKKQCSGADAFLDRIAGLSWQEIVANSGVEKKKIDKVASLYAQSDNAILCWSMGLTHHLHGVANIQTLVALAASRGMIGRQGTGLLPLRGHSNIQGTGSMGFTPQLKRAIEQAFERHLDITLPNEKGLDTMACMDAAFANNMDVAIMLGGNLYASNPDTQFAEQALNRVGFKCFINSTLNLGHVNGVEGEALILPIRVRDEEPQATTQESMFNFVRLSDGGPERILGLLSETELICSLGERVIEKERFDFSVFRDLSRTRTLISKSIPGLNNLDSIDKTKKEFHVEGRIFHSPIIPTDDGKVKLKFHSSPQRNANSFYLSSVRSEGQFNSIIYHQNDSYRNQTSRNVLMMNPIDIKLLNLREGSRVNIRSAVGELKDVVIKPFDIRQGNVMTYYPEANVLIPKDVDTASRTPAFKRIEIEILSLD